MVQKWHISQFKSVFLHTDASDIDCDRVYVTHPFKVSKAFSNVPDIGSDPHRPWSHSLNPRIESSWTPRLMEPVPRHNHSSPAALQMLWSTHEGHQSICEDIEWRMRLMSPGDHWTSRPLSPSLSFFIHSLQEQSCCKFSSCSRKLLLV